MSARTLHIAEGLALPLEAVTQTFGILAVRGAGKSNLAAAMAEEMFEAGLPFVVVDPVGSWWGLRSSSDGKGPGLPIPIFGGRHGDVPLEETGGQVLADLAADERASFVLDCSELSESAKTRFLIDFAERLYRRNAEPLHLFLEEADDYAPQRPFREQARLLRAWENVVRRGRARGLGITLVTQRSAALNKNVLTQIETLFVLRTTSPQDRKAIEAWVTYHGQSDEILESLAQLESGEAWVWSPSWLKLTKRVRIRRRATFDSGATPKKVQGSRAAATLADVDLGQVRARMAATIERAEKEDPKKLRARIATLERELAAKPVPPPAPKVEEKRVEVPILTEAQVARLERTVEKLLSIGDLFVTAEAPLREALERFARKPTPAVQPRMVRPAPREVAPSPVRRAAPASANGHLDGPTRMERAMLTALAQHPDGLSKGRILLHTGYRLSGPVSTAFATLNANGWAEPAMGGLRITDAGLRVLGDYDPLPTGDALRELLLTGDKLSPMERKLLAAIADAYPAPIAKGVVLERAGYASSGPVSTAFARLVSYGYAVAAGASQLRASDVLFE